MILSLRNAAFAAAAAVSIAAASPALADANVGLQVLRENNLTVLGTLTSTSNVEGRTFVGGDLKGSASDYFKFNAGKTPPASANPGLTVVGNVESQIHLLNGSGAAIGGNQTGSLDINSQNQTLTIGGGAHNINGSQGSTITIGGAASGYLNKNNATLNQGADLTAFKQALADDSAAYALGVKDLSAYLAGLTKTDEVSFPFSNRIQFNPTQASGNVAVFDLANTGIFNSVGEIDFQANGYDTIIVNVGGLDAAIGKNFIGNASGLGQHVIWNFYEAKTLDLGANSFYGSVLAPYAAGKIGNFIEGSAVFASLTQNGELHLNGYTGGLTIPAPPTSAVPEPATWAMMIMGFGLVGTLARRRRAVVAA